MTLRYTISLLIGFATLIVLTQLIQFQWFAISLLLITVLWIIGLWQAWPNWLGHLGLFSISTASVVGLLAERALEVMFFSHLLGLLAWDLSFLEQSLSVSEVRNRNLLIRRHLYRLLFVLSLGLLLGSITLNLQLKLPLFASIFLGLLVFWGLSYAIRFLRGRSD